MKKILLVEDDRIISKGLKQALENEKYEVRCAFDGDQGLEVLRTDPPDLVVLDIMMPNLNGFEFTTEVRRLGEQVPIIILSARNEKVDKIRGLDLGADDYVTKPFDLDELLARIRRFLKITGEKIQEIGTLKYVWKDRLLRGKRDTQISLTTKERKLLEFLLKRQNQIVTRDQILDGVWGSEYSGTDRTVDNLIVALRKKLDPESLLTERGLGYRLVTKP